MKTITKCTLLAAAAACTMLTGCDSEEDLQRYRLEENLIVLLFHQEHLTF